MYTYMYICVYIYIRYMHGIRQVCQGRGTSNFSMVINGGGMKRNPIEEFDALWLWVGMYMYICIPCGYI